MLVNSTVEVPAPGLALLVNGASSSGKSTLCRALAAALTVRAANDPVRLFGTVAFDDVVLLCSENMYAIDFVRGQGRDPSNLVSQAPFDGRAAWEYVDESDAMGIHGGSPRVRLVMHPFTRRLLRGLHLGWATHLALGSNLVIDHFLQDQDWVDECLAAIREVGARVVCVRVDCDLADLERRESSRADGNLEGRPAGLARRSDELCHSHGIEYDVRVSTSTQSIEESVATVIATLDAIGFAESQPPR